MPDESDDVPDHLGLDRVWNERFPLKAIPVGDVPAGMAALADPLLAALEQAFDDLLAVLLGDRLADLPQQHVAAVLAVVRGHIGDENPYAVPLETPEQVLGDPHVSREPIERGDNDRAHAVQPALMQEPLELWPVFKDSALPLVAVELVDEQALGLGEQR